MPIEEYASTQPVEPVLLNIVVPEGSLIYLFPENFLWVELSLHIIILESTTFCTTHYLISPLIWSLRVSNINLLVPFLHL